MRILLLPAYFAPEQMASSHLNENRFQSFADAGIDMSVYVPMPTRGIDEETRHLYKNKPKENLYNGHLTLVRFSMFREGRNPIVRAFRYMLCFLKQFYYGLRAKDIDLIYLSSTPPIQGVLGGWLKKIKKVPFVYNLQDIFPDSLSGTGLAKKDGFLWKIGRLIEDYTYRHADKIIVISEDFKRNIMAKGVSEDKIEVIYNWVDETKVYPIKNEENPLFEELGIRKDSFRVVYAGNLGNAQNVRVLLDVAKQLQTVEDLDFIIFGTGGLESDYKQYVEDNKIQNVRFFPLQPSEKISQVYSMADVSMVSCQKGLGGSAMPSKTWSILSAGTPVVCSFDKGGDLQQIVEGNKLGLFADANDVERLAENVMTLYNNRKMCTDMGKNGREFILKNLTRKVGTQKYVDVIKHFNK